MTTAEQVHAAIAAGGGHVVSSWAFGDVVRTSSGRRPSTCRGCGAHDHTLRRCNGPGREPAPLVDPPNEHRSSPRC